MTGIIVLRQRDAVYAMTDTAEYTADALLVSVDSPKCIAVSGFNAAVASSGPSECSPMLAARIADEFSSFDDLIASAEEALPAMFQSIMDETRDGDGCASVCLVGWHERDDRPAAYGADMWTAESSMMKRVAANSGAAAAQVTNGRLVEFKQLGGSLPPLGALRNAGFVFRANDEYLPDVDLLHVLSVLRHTPFGGRYVVGGSAVLHTITRDGFSRRVVHTWPEDRPGEFIEPEAIGDWGAWRLARQSTGGTPPVGERRTGKDGMSKLRADMLRRKQLKFARRAG